MVVEILPYSLMKYRKKDLTMDFTDTDADTKQFKLSFDLEDMYGNGIADLDICSCFTSH